MKITLDEWIELERLANEAARATAMLNKHLFEKLVASIKEDINSRETELFRRLEARTSDAQTAIAADLYHIQSEWTGGDSSDPRNTTLREPNWVQIAHTFPPEQVAKYRDPETGDITIPHRQQRNESS